MNDDTFIRLRRRARMALGRRAPLADQALARLTEAVELSTDEFRRLDVSIRHGSLTHVSPDIVREELDEALDHAEYRLLEAHTENLADRMSTRKARSVVRTNLQEIEHRRCCKTSSCAACATPLWPKDDAAWAEFQAAQIVLGRTEQQHERSLAR